MVYGQKQNGTIDFKDGLINIKDNHEIKFRTNKDTKKVVIHTSARMEKRRFEGYEMKCYKNTDNLFQGSDRLIYKITDGEVSVHKDIMFVNYSNHTRISIQRETIVYYIDKDNEELVKIYPGTAFGKSSDRVIAKYFQDRPRLIELLDRDALGKFVKIKKGLRSQFRL